jgi:DNA-binding GntR family transcriptional regulator
MQRYEVSDGTVKRALALLREEGLVETETGRRVYVK